MAGKKTEYIDVMSPRARLSYPHIDKPEKFKEKDGSIKEGKYCVTLLFCTKGEDAGGKGVVDLKEMKTAAIKVAEAMFGPRADWSPKLKKNFKWPFKNGDDEVDNDGYEGMTFVKTGSKDAPGIVDIKRRPIKFSTKVSPDTLYAGCFVRATLTAAAFDIDGGRGVTFYLKNIQKLAEGPAFSNREDAHEAFNDDVSEEAEEASAFDSDLSGGNESADDGELDLSI